MCPDGTRTGVTICAYPGCTKAVWRDPDGSFSQYCSVSHRDSAVSKINQNSICKNCHARPVYVENGKAHDFCGLRCATAARSGNGARQALAPINVNQGRNAVCAITGCGRPVFVNQQGNPGEYCSQRHRQLAIQNGAEACLFCGEWPKATINGRKSDFCSKRCKDDTANSAPMILEVPPSHEAFESVANQFTTKWLHTLTPPKVYKVYKIYSSKDHMDEFGRYKLGVERRTGLEGGNSNRRFHGTVRACHIGDHYTGFCSDEDCSLCRILESSFEVARFGQRTNFGRFGAGIYTSATSSKANDYVGELAMSNYQAMLLTEVIMGKAIKLTVGNQNLTAPPQGYDSVIGEPGGDLNYDECIVYKVWHSIASRRVKLFTSTALQNEAIRPLYLIIFSKPSGGPTVLPRIPSI
ncbi:uncharacterized protein PHACADRAFT_211824 [Phanerochaete carnosa HHB-10118-sp]|uniref:PARP catalytic domain-containing protein n=1 Tax=Phanerochaete carnosa (strain HHB-10118-sp) TaxID=650164 RepID=K5URQ8_PHACS|nr:uncharacterized protein PHACADRAFT_211824 [Phanerochaete carnosa HHB-10118-sp]EKM52581.1 hypothetical protein PHACADRAFT_211824 [Phanerochaete carnosa HHB-10118-sp]